MTPEPDWADEFGTNEQISADASDVWQRIAKDIDIPPSQRDAAVTYCLSVARVAEAERHISEHGLVMVGANGTPVKNPATTIINMYSAGVRALQNSLGLTPYAATRNAAMAKNAKSGCAGYDPDGIFD